MATERTKNWQGSKWCRPERRLAIYLRDGLACCWCGEGIEDGAQLSLDHCRVHVAGGGNETRNLITSCRRCNSSRGSRSLAVFARAVAEYLDHGRLPEDILAHIRRCRARRLPMDEAKTLLARRGTLTAALAAEI